MLAMRYKCCTGFGVLWFYRDLTSCGVHCNVVVISLRWYFLGSSIVQFAGFSGLWFQGSWA